MTSLFDSIRNRCRALTFPDHWPARVIFLLDGLGAGVSLGMVFVVLRFQPWFGMPLEVVKFLLPLTACFMTGSLLCWLFNPERWRFALFMIALANLCYAAMTIVLLVVYRGELTPLGFAFFASETVVLMALGYLEIRKSLSSPLPTSQQFGSSTH